MKMPLVKAIKLLALEAVISPKEDYFLRKVQRWYSRQFYTPLPEVEDLPIQDILLHYFECKYEDLKEADDTSDWINEMIYATETAEEKRKREMTEESNEASDEDFLREVMQEEQAKKANKIENIQRTEKAPIPTNRDRGEVELPKPEMSEIKMSFISEKEMAELAEFDVLGDLSPKKG